MRKLIALIMTGAAATAMASSAGAQTLSTVNGPNLDTHITASLANPINDTTTVYGTTVAGDDNVVFTGNTAIHITDGNGFASISDSTGIAGSFTQLVMNPEQTFSQYQFSVALDTAGYILVEYMLTGSATWSSVLTGGNVSDPFAQAASTNKDYQLNALAGQTFDAIRLTSCVSATTCNAGGTGGAQFSFVKQNSITLATAAVPEPGTWAMMLIGFGAAGYSLRRRKKVALQAA